MDKNTEMNKMEVGTTFRALLNGNEIYFAKIDKDTWYVRICTVQKNIRNSCRRFYNMCTEKEAADIWAQCA